MDKRNLQQVIVTHVANPEAIWVFNMSENESLSGNIILKLSKVIEQEFAAYEKSENNGTEFEKGDFIGIYYKPLDLWARAVVDQIFFDSSILVWLLDFGFHLIIQNLPDSVTPLSSAAMDLTPPLINKVGVYGVVPLRAVRDPILLVTNARPSRFWLPDSIKILQDNFKKATKVEFSQKHIFRHSDGSEQKFGNFWITVDGKNVDLVELLKDSKLGEFHHARFIEALPTMGNVTTLNTVMPHGEKQISTAKKIMEFLNHHNKAECSNQI